MTAGQAEVLAPPLWTALPFVAYLLTIAIAPLAFPHFWEHNRNKLILGLIASLPVVLYLASIGHQGMEWLHHALREYLAFIALLASLFVIAGGVYLRGALAGTPLVNTAFLGIGALLASFIGTTGASMLLIRPLLRANESRQRKVHIVVFFIFIVSNGAGMLTPLGDPPLFLGFLRGVPFLWTFQLIGPWALVERRAAGRSSTSSISACSTARSSERAGLAARRGDGDRGAAAHRGRRQLPVAGRSDRRDLRHGPLRRRRSRPARTFARCSRSRGMAAMAGLSLLTTAKASRAANQFAWAPDPRGGGHLPRHLRDHGAGAQDPRDRRRRARRDRAVAVLLGDRRALELPRQRAHLPHLRVARGRRRQRSRPRRRLQRRPPRRPGRTTRWAPPS